MTTSPEHAGTHGPGGPDGPEGTAQTHRDEPSTWYALTDGTLLLSETDPETGAPAFSRWRPARPLGPDDLRAYDRASAESVKGLRRRMMLAIGAGLVFLLGGLVAVVGFVLYQLDAAEAVGGTLFWLGLPVAVLGLVLRLVTTWMLKRPIARAQVASGFEPFAAETLDEQQARALIASQGTTFVLERDR